ncbi:D-tagatose-bisphosphate aldolase, class II, non-catalytic subunit [Pseudoalteromonas sp. T1lg75]|uniref:D-tagatose-bisphosphate aldolase, class II, non-catalytic subunit n=1 Tax=Pseudoalteromonas sp. T1lg75 TaxID=2077102 RepID=UPI000CF61FCB|nr:D-tagatose-bisphosphate aldolase, class II, non-catalytic subunit [Pseudoalteromonas sp. T1lg75]
MKALKTIINNNRAGQLRGVYSVCCAHPLVIEAAMRQSLKDDSVLLIEATANQVNQYGGYTGMTPQDFVSFVHKIARKVGLATERIILGGDHLGPVCWVDEPATQAMEKAVELVKAYASAGFKKIHLDASMPCSDDGACLSDAEIAKRAALMCHAAEQACGDGDIMYVVGTEVPPPGGAKEDLQTIEVSDVAGVQQTIELHQEAFRQQGVESVWSRVIAVVVQPGVEFDNHQVFAYQRAQAKRLKDFIGSVDNLVYEVHSTDYQPEQSYHELVQDHFAILKVGPQLTYALREALFSLSYIEEQLIAPASCSQLRAVCEEVMLEKPGYWDKFYKVADEHAALYRAYSYSDRIRYYWPEAKLQQAVSTLFNNLAAQPIPETLLSQFMPNQFNALRKGDISATPRDLVLNKIMEVTNVYSLACNQ